MNTNVTQSPPSTKSLHWYWILVVVIVAIIPRLFFLNIPFERDEGTYATVAQVIDRGGLPYRDAFDHKPPLIFYIFWLSFTLFGEIVAAPRLLAAVFIGAACWILFTLVWRLTSSRLAAMTATLLFGLSSASPGYNGYDGNTEVFTLFFIISGLYFAVFHKHQLRRILFSALLFGIGIMIKQPVGLIGVSLLGYIIIKYFPKKIWRAIAVSSLGLGLPLVCTIAFFAVQGGWSAFWEGWFYNLSYIQAFSWTGSIYALWPNLEMVLSSNPGLWIFGVPCIAIYLWHPGTTYRGWLSIFLLGTVISIALGRRFFGHYFLFMLPVLSLSIGLAFGTLLRHHQNIGRGLVIAALIFSSLTFWAPWKEPPARALQEKFRHFPPGQSVDVGTYLLHRPSRARTAFILGGEPEILFYARLHSPTRFIYAKPLEMQHPQRDMFRQEAFADITRLMPEYLILKMNSLNLKVRSPSLVAYYRRLLNHFSSYRLIAVSSLTLPELMTDPQALANYAYQDDYASMLVFVRPDGLLTENLPTVSTIMSRLTL